MPSSTQSRSTRPRCGRRVLGGSLLALQALRRRPHRSGLLAAATLGTAALMLLGASAALARIAYVTNETSHDVTPINLATNEALAPITDTIGTSSIAITPNGKLAYATSFTHDLLTPFNLEGAGSALTPIVLEVGGKERVEPEAVAIAPNGKFVYVADEETETPLPGSLRYGGSVSMVEVATGKVVKVIPAGFEPVAVAITPNGEFAWVGDKANVKEGAVEVINTATNEVVKTIDVGSNEKCGQEEAPGDCVEPESVAITPNGQTVYVADGAAGTVTVIDDASNPAGAEVVNTIKTGAGGSEAKEPDEIAIAPNGQTAYVSNGTAGTVVPIDLVTQAAGSPITVGREGSTPHGLAITPSGKTLYVAVEEEKEEAVKAIDTATNEVVATIHVAGNPSAVAIVPDQGPTAAFSASTAAAGSASSFDGASSSDLEGKVASYAWSFGDGATATTGTPTTSHVYAAPGTYKVTLTVTDEEGCSVALLFTGQTSYCDADPAAQTSTTITVPGPGTKTKAGSVPGRARVASLAIVKHGKVQVRLTCTGKGACAGSLSLVASIVPKGGGKGRGKHAHNAVIGRDSFSIGQGKSEVVRVPLSAKGASLLAKAGRHGLEVSVKGSDIQAGKLLLKEAPHKHRGSA